MVYYWKLTRTDRWRGDRQAFSERLRTDHARSVYALAYCPSSKPVYSAAGDCIAMTKLDALAPAGSQRVSSRINQVHVHPQDPRLVVLEASH